jgi:4,5-dihydroxyphthalate decarboxylase
LKEDSLAFLDLTCALTANERTRLLLDGSVKPDAMHLEITRLDPSEMFFRQLKKAEFDVSEMSVASFMIATSKGPTQWVGLPVFTTRRFFHTNVLVRTDAGIESIKDLAGKRIGVPEFQQTAAVWARGILRDEFGFDPKACEWFMERNPELSHGGVTGFSPPPGIRLQYVSRDDELGAMIIEGRVDALLNWTLGNNLVDRTTVDPLSSPKVKRFFDPGAEARRYYAKTKLFPINHCCIVRRSIVEEHPWVVLNLFNWFSAAKAKIAAERDSLLDPYFVAGLLDPKTKPAFATDLIGYGVKSSRAVLETISRYLFEDGLTSRRVALEEIFHESTLDL